MKLNEKNARFAVVKTAFHGGGVISYHRSITEALKADKKFSSGGCTCGCCRVIPITEEAREELFEQSYLGSIIKAVEHALSYKLPIVRLTDKIASIFVPVVLSLSVLTFVYWYVFINVKKYIICSSTIKGISSIPIICARYSILSNCL